MNTIEKKWTTEFKRNRESIENYPHSRRPSTLTTQVNIEKTCDMIIGDRRLKIKEIAGTVGITYERTENIIVNWNFLRFLRDGSQFLDRFVTMDKTWDHQYTPESKQQSK